VKLNLVVKMDGMATLTCRPTAATWPAAAVVLVEVAATVADMAATMEDMARGAAAVGQVDTQAIIPANAAVALSSTLGGTSTEATRTYTPSATLSAAPAFTADATPCVVAQATAVSTQALTTTTEISDSGVSSRRCKRYNLKKHWVYESVAYLLNFDP